MEESYQDARVGTAPAGNGDVGIHRLPSPSRGSCQHLGLHLFGARHGGARSVHDDSALSGHAASKMAPAGIFQNASSLSQP